MIDRDPGGILQEESACIDPLACYVSGFVAFLAGPYRADNHVMVVLRPSDYSDT
jgi:hypothetical protein